MSTRRTPYERPAGAAFRLSAGRRVLLAVAALACAAAGAASADLLPPPSEPSSTATDPARRADALPPAEPALVARVVATRNAVDPRAALDTLLQRPEGVPAAALLRAMVQPEEPYVPGVRTRADPIRDRHAYPIACALRDSATPPVDAALFELLRDRDVHVRTRFAVATALCRPGPPEHVRRLVDVVVDLDVPRNVREAVLVRLARTEAPPPPRLRDLLYDAMTFMDLQAAAVLGALGDLEAPSLVVRRIELAQDAESAWAWCFHAGPTEELRLCVQALRRVVPGGTDVDAALARAEGVVTAYESGRPASPADVRAVAGDALALLRPWLAEHPEVFDTEFERRRRAYRSSDRRRRELRSADTQALATLADDEIDVAAAVLAIRDPEIAEWALDRFDRLAAWLGPQLDEAATPREKMAFLQERLVPKTRFRREQVDPNLLRNFLLDRSGICLTWSTTFLAIGERLDLPLTMIRVPRHVYLRWDDGETVFNFDPSRGGEDVTDEEYVRELAGERAAKRLRERVRVLDHHGVVSTNLSNTLGHRFDGLPSPDNVALGRLAVQLDPGNTAAWVQLAQALSPDDDVAAETMQEVVSQFYDPAEPDVERASWAARLLARAGASDEALGLLAELPESSRSRPNVRVARAEALVADGDVSRALAAIDALPALPVLRIQALRLYRLLRLDESAGVAGLAGSLRSAVEDPGGTDTPIELMSALERDAATRAFVLHRAVADVCFLAPDDDARAAEIACDLLSPFFDRRRDSRESAWDGHAPLYGERRVCGLLGDSSRQAQPAYHRALRRFARATKAREGD